MARKKKGDNPRVEGAPQTLLNVRANFDPRTPVRAQAPARDAPTVKLVGKCDFCRETFVLPQGSSTMGRVLGACIVLVHEQISRRHATFEVDGERVRLVDHGSRNGTFVNGVQVREAELHNGDLLAFGRELHFRLDIETPPQASVEAAAPEPITQTGGSDSPLATLERERMQLAVLFSLSLRYLRQGPTQEPIDVLFEVLDKLVAFDAAFAIPGPGRGAPPLVHPKGLALTPTDCARAEVPGAGAEVAVLEAPGEALSLQGRTLRSRAHLPFGPGGHLVLLSTESHGYSDRLEFLGLLAELHSAASHRATFSNATLPPRETLPGSQRP